MRVAVLLATYNGAPYLEAQLDSLLAQDGVEVGVFARDDGSSDATVDILERRARHWPALAAPMVGARMGAAGNFLELLATAPDDFDAYAFCDQDDVWRPDKLARAMDRLGGVEGPALYCSSVLVVDEQLCPLGERRLGGDTGFEHLLFENFAFGATVVMNAAARRLVRSRLPQSGVIMHDWWSALVVSAFGVIVRDDQPGVLYRQHRANVIGAAPSRFQETLGHLKRLWRDPARFYPIRAQAEEFLLRHRDALAPRYRAAAEALVQSNRSFAARVRFALFGRVVRARAIDAIAVRALILLGWC